MSVRTKPIRVFESDIAPIRLVAEINQLSPAEVVHVALAQYLHDNRKLLGARFLESQRAVAEGDLEALTSLLRPGAASMVKDLMSDLEQYR